MKNLFRNNHFLKMNDSRVFNRRSEDNQSLPDLLSSMINLLKGPLSAEVARANIRLRSRHSIRLPLGGRACAFPRMISRSLSRRAQVQSIQRYSMTLMDDVGSFQARGPCAYCSPRRERAARVFPRMISGSHSAGERKCNLFSCNRCLLWMKLPLFSQEVRVLTVHRVEGAQRLPSRE